MKGKGTLLGLMVAVIALLAMPVAAQAKTTITISGSTTVAPLATLLAKAYIRTKAGSKVGFKILQGGSDIGVSDVARGRVTIGMSSRTPKASDPGGLVFNEIAKDALCIATNPANGVTDFSEQMVQNVFGGRIRDWKDVPGARSGGTINVVIRTAASGTQDAFLKIFMGSTKVFSGASQKASNGLIQQAVASDPQAVGYVGHSFTKGVTIANYKGVPCDLRAAKSGQYPGTRPLYFVTNGAATGAVAKWINWIRNNPTALKIAAREWVPFK
ncbi:MAG: phosphate ABC transporter substrate-binding protein [Solirubrobacterales bacterium]|nr:phosphate ABC transporter substrate-binding protein [Solirubrobacterales bacterium]